MVSSSERTSTAAFLSTTHLGEGTPLAEHIPGAVIVEQSGDDHAIVLGPDRGAAVFDAIEFLTAPGAGPGTCATASWPRSPGLSRAIGAACAIRDRVRDLGVEVRAGLHTGECEVMGDDVAGVAVHTAARVAGLAGANEVLVSSTVKDLVTGSGLRFADRGHHELKGVPVTWALFSVA